MLFWILVHIYTVILRHQKVKSGNKYYFSNQKLGSVKIWKLWKQGNNWGPLRTLSKANTCNPSYPWAILRNRRRKRWKMWSRWRRRDQIYKKKYLWMNWIYNFLLLLSSYSFESFMGLVQFSLLLVIAE